MWQNKWVTVRNIDRSRLGLMKTHSIKEQCFNLRLSWISLQLHLCSCAKLRPTQLAFYVNIHRAVIGPSATLTGRWRPDIDLRRMLTGKELQEYGKIKSFSCRKYSCDVIFLNCVRCTQSRTLYRNNRCDNAINNSQLFIKSIEQRP